MEAAGAENLLQFEEIDLDEETVINKNDILFDDYEGTEVEIEDVDWDDFEGLDESILNETPVVQIKFVNEDQDEMKIIQDEVKIIQDLKQFICDKCKRKYKRESYFKKHVAICGT